MKTLLKNLTYRLMEVYFGFRRWKLVWIWLNRKSRIKPAIGRKIYDEIQKNGIYETHIDPRPYQEYLKTLTPYARGQKGQHGKDFLESYYPKHPTFPADNPFVRLALSDFILDMASSYIGSRAKLFLINLSITHIAAEPPKASQLWHRDPEDRKQLKAFLYLTDVDANSGPFIYMKESQRDGKYGGLWKQKPPVGTYVEEEKLFKKMDQKNVKVCTGPAGTLIFADTVGFHRGGHATKKERIMLTLAYRSEASSHAWDTHVEYDDSLSEKAKYAIHHPKTLTMRLEKIHKSSWEK